MEVEEFRYTWVLPRKAWYVSLYLWMWDADADDITFCKLFWGYVFCWVGIPYAIFSSIVLTAISMVECVKSHKTKRVKEPKSQPRSQPRILVYGCRRAHRQDPVRPARRILVGKEVHFIVDDEVNPVYNPSYYWRINGSRSTHNPFSDLKHTFTQPGRATIILEGEHGVIATKVIKVRAKPSLGVRFIDAVASGFSGALMFCHRPRVADVLKGLGLMGFAIVLGAAVSLGLYGIYLGIVALIHSPWGAITHAASQAITHYGPMTGLGLIAMVVLIAFIYGMLALGVWGFLRSFVLGPTVLGTKHGALSFGKMMKVGYRAVKSNTCPRVVIDEEEE